MRKIKGSRTIKANKQNEDKAELGVIVKDLMEKNFIESNFKNQIKKERYPSFTSSPIPHRYRSQAPESRPPTNAPPPAKRTLENEWPPLPSDIVVPQVKLTVENEVQIKPCHCGRGKATTCCQNCRCRKENRACTTACGCFNNKKQCQNIH